MKKIKNHKISTKGYLPNSPDKNEPSLVIPSQHLTTKGVPHRILAEDLETGEKRIMNPEEEHFFNGKKGIKETPLQKGGQLYADSLANYNKAKAKWEKDRIKFGSDLSYGDLKSTTEFEEWKSPTDIGRIGFADLMYDDKGSMIPVSVPIYEKPETPIIAKPSISKPIITEKVKETILFDPEGTDYDMESAIKAGLKADSTGHWPSRDPKTGMILKGTGHETFYKTLEGEDRAGYEIQKGKDNRYYSFPKKNSIQYIEGTPGKEQHFKYDSLGEKFPLSKDGYNRLLKEGKMNVLDPAEFNNLEDGGVVGLQQGGVISEENIGNTSMNEGSRWQQLVEQYQTPIGEFKNPDTKKTPEEDYQERISQFKEMFFEQTQETPGRLEDFVRTGHTLGAPVQSSLESFSSSFALGKDMIEKSFWDKMEADAEQGVGFGNIIRQYLGKEWIPARIEDNAKDIERNYAELAAKYDEKHLELSDMWKNPERFWAHELPEIMGQAIPLVALPLGGAAVGLAVGNAPGMIMGGIAGSAMGVYQEAMSEAGDVVHRAYEELVRKYPNADKKDLVRQAFELSETSFDRQTAALIMTEMPQLAINLFLPGTSFLTKTLKGASRAGIKGAEKLLKAQVKYGKTANVVKLGTYLTGNVIVEGGQEGIQYVVNEDILNTIRDPEYQKGLSWSELWDDPDFIENVKSGGLMGIVMGGGFRTLNSAIQTKVNDLAKKTPTEISDYLSNSREQIYLTAIASNKDHTLKAQIELSEDAGAMADKTITNKEERVKKSKEVGAGYKKALEKRSEIWDKLGLNKAINSLPLVQKIKSKTQAYFNKIQIDKYKEDLKSDISIEEKEEVKKAIKYLELWNNALFSEKSKDPLIYNAYMGAALGAARAFLGLSESEFKKINALVDEEIGDYIKIRDEIIRDKTPFGKRIKNLLTGTGIKVEEEKAPETEKVEEVEKVKETPLEEQKDRLTISPEQREDLKQRFVNAIEQETDQNIIDNIKASALLLDSKFLTQEQIRQIQDSANLLPKRETKGIKKIKAVKSELQEEQKLDEAVAESLPTDFFFESKEEAVEHARKSRTTKVKDAVGKKVIYKENENEFTFGTIEEEQGVKAFIPNNDQGFAIRLEDETILSDIGITLIPDQAKEEIDVTASEVEMGEKDNEYSIRGKVYKNGHSKKENAINRDTNGNIISVTLTDEKGNNKTFRNPEIVDSIAYNILLSVNSKTIKEDITQTKQDAAPRKKQKVRKQPTREGTKVSKEQKPKRKTKPTEPVSTRSRIQQKVSDKLDELQTIAKELVKRLGIVEVERNWLGRKAQEELVKIRKLADKESLTEKEEQRLKNKLNQVQEHLDRIDQKIDEPISKETKDEAIQNIKKKSKPTQQSSEAKEGVSELFEFNPELANQVYEALGFKNEVVELDFSENRDAGNYKSDKFEISVSVKAFETDYSVDVAVADKSSNTGYRIHNGLSQTFKTKEDAIEYANTVIKKDKSNNQITTQQKQQAQQKFQEYVDTTGKQDIEGFKEFVKEQPAEPAETLTEEEQKTFNELESYAKEQGYSPAKGQPIWKYAIQSINKQKRTVKEKELPVTKESFEKLTKKQIAEAALSSESIQLKKQQEKEALERPAPQPEEAPKPTAKQTREEKAEQKRKDKEKKIEEDENQLNKDFDKLKTKNRGKFSSTPIDPELVSLLARYIDIQIRKGILSIEKLILKLKNYLKKNNIKNADEIIDNNINEILKASNRGSTLLKQKQTQEEVEEEVNEAQEQGEEIKKDEKEHGLTVKEISRIIFKGIPGIEKEEAQKDLMAISTEIYDWVLSQEKKVTKEQLLEKFSEYEMHSEQMGLFIPNAVENFTADEIVSVVSTFFSQKLVPFIHYLHNKAGVWQMRTSNVAVAEKKIKENLKKTFKEHTENFEKDFIEATKAIPAKDKNNYKNKYEEILDNAERNNETFMDSMFSAIMESYNLKTFQNENNWIVKKWGKVGRSSFIDRISSFPYKDSRRKKHIEDLLEFDLDVLQYLTGLRWEPFLAMYEKDYKEAFSEQKIKNVDPSTFFNALTNFVFTKSALNATMSWEGFKKNIESQFSSLIKGLSKMDDTINYKSSFRGIGQSTKSALIEKNELIISAENITKRTGDFFNKNLLVQYYRDKIKSPMPIWAIDGVKNDITQDFQETGKISPSDYIAMQLTSFMYNNIFEQKKENARELEKEGILGEFGMTMEQMGAQEQQVYVGAIKYKYNKAKEEYEKLLDDKDVLGIPNEDKFKKYAKELEGYINNELKGKVTLGKTKPSTLAKHFMYNFIVNKHNIDLYFQGETKYYIKNGVIQYLKEQVKRSQSRWSNGNISLANIEGGFNKELRSVIVNDPKKTLEILGISTPFKDISDGVVLFSNEIAKQATVSWGSLLSKGRDANTIMKLIYSKIRDNGMPYQIKSEWVALPDDFTAMSPELNKINWWMFSNKIDVLVFGSSAKLKEEVEVMSLFEKNSDQLLAELPSPKENQVLPIDTNYLLLQQDAIKDVQIKKDSNIRVQPLRHFSIFPTESKDVIYQQRNNIIEKRKKDIEKILGANYQEWIKRFDNSLTEEDYDKYHKELLSSIEGFHPHLFAKEDSIIGRTIGNKLLKIKVQGNSYRAFPDMRFTHAYDENGKLFKLKEPLQPMRITKEKAPQPNEFTQEEKEITFKQWKKLSAKEQQEYTVRPAQHLVPLNSGLEIKQQIITTRAPSDGFQNHPIGEVIGFLPASMHNLIVVDPITQEMAGEDNDADERHVWARLRKGKDEKEVTKMFDAIWNIYTNPKYFEALTSPIKQGKVKDYLLEEKKQQGLIDKYDFVNGHTQAYKLVKESSSMIGPIARSIAILDVLAAAEVSLYAPLKFPKYEEKKKGKFEIKDYYTLQHFHNPEKSKEDLLIAILEKSETMKIIGNENIDAPKLQNVELMGLTEATVNSFVLLAMLGVDIKHIINFFKQDSIKDFINQAREGLSVANKKSSGMVLNEVLQNAVMTSQEENQQLDAMQLYFTEIGKWINTYVTPLIKRSEIKKHEVNQSEKVLAMLSKINKISKDLLPINELIGATETGPKNYGKMKAWEDSLNKIINNKATYIDYTNLANSGTLETLSYISPSETSLTLAQGYYEKYRPIGSRLGKIILNSLKRYYSLSPYFAKQGAELIIPADKYQAINNGLNNIWVATALNELYGKEFKSQAYTKREAFKELRKAKKDIKDNEFLNALKIEDNILRLKDSIAFKADLNIDTINDYKSEFAKLPKKLQNLLVAYSFYQHLYNESTWSGSYAKFISNEKQKEISDKLQTVLQKWQNFRFTEDTQENQKILQDYNIKEIMISLLKNDETIIPEVISYMEMPSSIAKGYPLIIKNKGQIFKATEGKTQIHFDFTQPAKILKVYDPHATQLKKMTIGIEDIEKLSGTIPFELPINQKFSNMVENREKIYLALDDEFNKKMKGNGLYSYVVQENPSEVKEMYVKQIGKLNPATTNLEELAIGMGYDSLSDWQKTSKDTAVQDFIKDKKKTLVFYEVYPKSQMSFMVADKEASWEKLRMADPKTANFIESHLKEGYPGVNTVYIENWFHKGLPLIGAALMNAVFLDESSAVQSTYYHEFAHMYWDALPDDNIIKKRMTEQFTDKESAIIAIGRAGVELGKEELHKLENKSNKFTVERFLSLLKKFWRAVKRAIGKGKDSNARKMAEAIWYKDVSIVKGKKEITAEDFMNEEIQYMTGQSPSELSQESVKMLEGLGFVDPRTPTNIKEQEEMNEKNANWFQRIVNRFKAKQDSTYTFQDVKNARFEEDEKAQLKRIGLVDEEGNVQTTDKNITYMHLELRSYGATSGWATITKVKETKEGEKIEVEVPATGIILNNPFDISQKREATKNSPFIPLPLTINTFFDASMNSNKALYGSEGSLTLEGIRDPNFKKLAYQKMSERIAEIGKKELKDLVSEEGAKSGTLALLEDYKAYVEDFTELYKLFDPSIFGERGRIVSSAQELVQKDISQLTRLYNQIKKKGRSSVAQRGYINAILAPLVSRTFTKLMQDPKFDAFGSGYELWAVGLADMLGLTDKKDFSINKAERLLTSPKDYREAVMQLKDYMVALNRQSATIIGSNWRTKLNDINKKLKSKGLKLSDILITEKNGVQRFPNPRVESEMNALRVKSPLYVDWIKVYVTAIMKSTPAAMTSDKLRKGEVWTPFEKNVLYKLPVIEADFWELSKRHGLVRAIELKAFGTPKHGDMLIKTVDNEVITLQVAKQELLDKKHKKEGEGGITNREAKKRWKDYQEQAEIYFDKGVDIEGHSLYNTTGIRVPLHGISFKLDNKIEEDRVSSNFAATIDNYINAKFFKHKMEEMIPMAYFFNSYYDSNSNKGVQEILSTYDEMAFMKKKPKSILYKQGKLEQILLFMTGWTAFRFLALNPLASIFNINAGQTQNIIDMGARPWAVAMLRYLKNPIKTYNIMKKMEIVNTSIDAELSLPDAFKNRFQNYSFILITIAENFNQALPFIGYMGEKWNDYDNQGNVKPGKKGMSYNDIYIAIDNIQRTHGAYHPLFKRQMNLTAEGMALMQFKGWLPETFLRMWQKEFVDSTGHVRKGILNSFFEEKSRKNIKKLLNGEMKYSEMPEIDKYNFGRGLRALVLTSLFMLLLSALDEDDNEARRNLRRALGDITYMFDIQNLTFLITSPVPALGTTVDLMKAFDAFISAETYKSDSHGGKKGDLKFVYKTVNVFPFSRMSKWFYREMVVK